MKVKKNNKEVKKKQKGKMKKIGEMLMANKDKKEDADKFKAELLEDIRKEIVRQVAAKMIGDATGMAGMPAEMMPMNMMPPVEQNKDEKGQQKKKEVSYIG